MKHLVQRLFPFNRQRQRPIVVVSGLPRSGTSLMMQILEAGGIIPLTDGLRQADADNPKGYYEYERVKKLDKGDVVWLADAEGKAVKVVSALVKFLPPRYAYRVIFMERALSEVLASQARMLQHRAAAAPSRPDATTDATTDDVTLAALFQHHLDETKEWLADQPSIKTLYVSHNELISHPADQIARIQEFLGGELNVAAMSRVVDPDLYRNQSV